MSRTTDQLREFCPKRCGQALRLFPASAKWAPEIPRGWPSACLDVINGYLSERSPGGRPIDEICCEDVAAAEILRSSGLGCGVADRSTSALPAVLLRTPISFEGEVPQLAALAVKTRRLTVVVDHFRHGELLSRAAQSAGKNIAVLIAVDTGRELMGVHPGPDCESLSRALVQQRGLRLRGIFADAEPSASAAGRQGLAAGRALELARHCLGHLRSRGIAAEDVVLGLGADEGLTAGLEADSCTLVWCPVEVCGGALWPATSATGVAACEVRVISRPALEFCVIAAGSRSGLMTSAARVLKPSGARVSGWDVHHTRLHLTGAAVDLRIGDTVTLGNFDKHT